MKLKIALAAMAFLATSAAIAADEILHANHDDHAHGASILM
jgi:hypothetical protein